MKWIKQVSFAAVLGISATSAFAAPIIEKPAVMPEAMFSVTVSDVHGLLDGVGSIAEQVSPMINGAMIKTMLGAQLGDPNLAGIATGKGLSVVALDADNYFGIIEVSEAQSSAYLALAMSSGIQAQYTNDVLVVGTAPEMVVKGIESIASVQELLLSQRSGTIRLAAQPGMLVEQNSEEIQALLQKIPNMTMAQVNQESADELATMKSATKILEAEVRVLTSILAQCESGELVIAPQNGSLRLNETFVSAMGTSLSTLLDSIKTETANPKIQSDLLGGGMLQIDFVLANPDVLTNFIAEEMESLVKEMSLTNLNVAAITEVMTKWTSLYSGTGCETVSFDLDDGLSVNCLIETPDEEQALTTLKTMKQDMAPLVNLYEKMGMDIGIELKENVSEYKGINIHRIEVEYDMEEMGAAQQDQLDVLAMENMDYDVAIFDGLLLYAMGENMIQKVIDRIKDPETTITPVEARGVYPADAFYYCDIDIGSYVQFVAAMMPEGSAPVPPELVASLQGADSITSAGFCDEGAVMCSINIPGDLIASLAQSVMMMQMQQQQEMTVPPVTP